MPPSDRRIQFMTEPVAERYGEALALCGLVNEQSERMVAIWATLLGACTFLALAAFGTDHRDLFLRSPLALPPPIAITIDLVGFYVVAPMLIVTLHLYLLVKLLLLDQAYRNFEGQTRRDAPIRTDRLQVRKHLNTTVFIQALNAWRNREGGSSGLAWLLFSVLALTIVLLPVITLLLAQARFLPYQSESVNLIHRLLLGIDTFAIGIVLRRITVPLKGKPSLAAHLLRGASYTALGAVTLTAWVILTFPMECYGEATDIALDDEKEPWLCLDSNAFVQRLPIKQIYVLWPNDQWSLSIAGDSGIRGGTLQLSRHDLVDETTIGGTKYVGISLDLRNRSFVNADLSGTDLRSSNFEHARMQLANLEDANLEDARFGEAQMLGVVLHGSALMGADFSETRMQGAQLSRSNLRGANFSYAWLQGADFERASMEGSDFEGAQLQGAYFSRARLQGSNFTDTRMHGTNFSRATMAGSDFTAANLQGAILVRADMRAADFSAAEMQGTTIIAAQVDGANFDDTRLEGAYFQSTSVWRSTNIGSGGEPPLVVSTIERTGSSAESIYEILQTIPEGHLKKSAASSLSALEEPFDSRWSSDGWLAIQEETPSNAIDIHIEIRKMWMLTYLCSKKEDYTSFALLRIADPTHQTSSQYAYPRRLEVERQAIDYTQTEIVSLARNCQTN